jgi:hypothetical protein
MKRAGGLIEKVADLDNLALAFWRAARGKAGSAEIEAFRAALPAEQARLREALGAGTVTFGPYRRFPIFDPKERWISVAPFGDRVVHHALMNVCEPVFERYCIHDTYACRRDKGCHRGVLRAQEFSRRFGWFVKLDIRKYYDSVDHDVLFRLLCRRFKDPTVLGLFQRLIDSYATAPGKGLPIGNLTSQHFANCYLGRLDHWAKEERRLPAYVRYMDDFVVWSDSKPTLTLLVREVRAFLAEALCLDLKDDVLVNRSERGLPFLGYRVFPDRILLTRRSRVRFRRKLLAYDRCWRSGAWSEAYAGRRVEALIAWTRFAAARGFRRNVLRLAEQADERIKICPEGIVHGLEPRDPGRELEQQQRQELPFGEPQQQLAEQQEQQYRLPPSPARSSPRAMAMASD